jgi:hypothetical protein
MYPPDHRCCNGSDADGGAFWRFDAEALPFQIKALGRQSQQCGGFLPPAAAPLRELEQGTFEVLGGRGHWLIEADDDLGGLERAFGRGNRPA